MVDGDEVGWRGHRDEVLGEEDAYVSGKWRRLMTRRVREQRQRGAAEEHQDGADVN
jgi:hypothetical protein